MGATGTELESLRDLVHQLKPTGEAGFEGLLATVLTDILKMHFVLAKSGSQQGRDGDAPLGGQVIKFEAKLYDDRVPREQVLSKLAEIAANDEGETDLWILGSTGVVAAQDVDTATKFGRRTGVSVLVFDWSGVGLPSLPTLLALAPDVAAKFLSGALGQDLQAVRAKLAAVEAHPQFTDRSREVRDALSGPSLAPAYALMANENWLRRAFENARRARAVFGQPLAPGDPAVRDILDRATIRDAFASFVFPAPNDTIAALLGVDGSGKSWLFAQTWLRRSEKVLTLVLVPNYFSEHHSRDAFEDLLISKCIAQTDDSPTEAARTRWRRYFERWRRLASPARPTMIVFVDGINERSNLPWDRILDTLNDLVGDLAGKLAISCRSAFFHDRLETRLLSAIQRTNVPEWSTGELEQLLSAKGIALAKLNPAVAAFLKNPRIFGVASQLLGSHQIERIDELSISRLLFEHIRSSDPGVPATTAEFVRHVRDHADIIVSRLHGPDTLDLTIFQTPVAGEPAGSTWPLQFNAVSAGRFFEPLETDPTLYRLKDDGLPLALGLSLLSSVQRAQRNGADLEEELARILDPIAALDKTSDVLLAAVVAAVLDDRSADEVAAALILALASLQNADSGRYIEFRALARSRPLPFLMALELGALRERLVPNLSWLTDALFEIRDDPRSASALTQYVHRWLNLFSDSPYRHMPRHGLNAEQRAAEYAKNKGEIDQRLAALSTGERKIFGELVPEERGDYAHLSSIAFRFLAGRPLAAFARSLRNWKFADTLNGGFTPYEEFRNLLSFNRVDWADARAALLHELGEFSGADVSASGRWARAGLLQATGAPEDAKEATALIEELTKDRKKYPGWRLIENYCATDPCDPASERPANFDATVEKYSTIDVSKIHNAEGPGPENHFFEGAMFGLARFAPEAAIAVLRKLADDILTRDGTAFRYGVFFLEDHTAALDDETAKRFVPKAAAASAQGLAEGDKHKQLWAAAQHALLIAFPHMSGNEQLGALVEYPKDDNIILELGDTLLPCDVDRYQIELLRAVDTDDVSVQFKLLMYARETGIELSDASKTLAQRLVISPSKIVRICALGLILRLQDIAMLKSVVSSGWTAASLNMAEDGFEIWYGSRILVQAAAQGLITDEDCLQRIAFSAYPSFVRARGSEGATLVAKRLDAAIERASGYRIERNLPEIEQRVDSQDRPAGYHIKERPNPRETQVEAFNRFAERAEAFYERQERNQAAFDAFERDLTRAGAELLIEFVTENLISEIAVSDLPLVKKWHQLFTGMDTQTLSKLHNIATLVAEAMSRSDPASAATLFERLIEAPPIVRVIVGIAGLDFYTLALWSAGDGEAVGALRFKRLDQAPNDAAIATEVLAALKAGKQDVLREYVADRLARLEPSYIARAIMVAGFSAGTEWAVQAVARFEDAHGFLGEAYEAAKFAMDRYKWSVHWTELIIDAPTETDLWRYGVILSKIVDGRFGYPVRLTRKPGSLLARYGNDIEDLIEARIKKWQDKRSKTLFGMHAPGSFYLT
jgi:hypothetical protein